MSNVHNNSPFYSSNHHVFKKSENKVEKTENEEKILTVFQEIFSLNQQVAKQLVDTIFLHRDALKESESITLPSNENIPFDVVITHNLAFCLLNNIGQGGFSDVYEASSISLQSQQFNGSYFSPSKTEKFALKKSKQKNQSYSPEKNLVNQATSPTKRGIDHSLMTFKENEGFAFSLHEKYDYSVSQAKFSEHPDPVSSIIHFLSSITNALDTIHKKGYIHRDIKGGNLLIRFENKEQLNAITDFGLLLFQPVHPHKTCGTAEYLDPTMFGTAAETLINQKKREGLQTVNGDIFALGITMIKDILLPLIQDCANHSTNEESFLELIKTLQHETRDGKFSDADLLKIGNLYPFRVMHRTLKNGDERIIRYPELSLYRETLATAVNNLSDFFSQEEIAGLLELGSIACDMQEVDLQKRPSLEMVKNELSIILQKLNYCEQKVFCNKKRPLDTKKYTLGPSYPSKKLRKEDLNSSKRILFSQFLDSESFLSTEPLELK